MFMTTAKHELEMEKQYRVTKQYQDSANLHRKEKDALEAKLTEQFEFKEKKAVAALEARQEKDKIKFERELQEKMSKFKEDELTKMYDKLSSSLTKLHEEGNANSKFIQEMNLTMANALVPAMATRQIENK